MSEFRRRLMMQVANDPNALPAGCVRLEQLRFNKTHWFNLDYIPKIGDEFYLTNISCGTTDLSHLFSSFDGDYQVGLTYQLGVNLIYFKYFATGAASRVGGFDSAAKHEILIKSNGEFVFISDTQKISATSAPTGSVNTTMFLGKEARNSTYFVGTLGEVVITRNNEEIVHLIPITDSQGTPCFYDLARKHFFYNQGAGDFLTN